MPAQTRPRTDPDARRSAARSFRKQGPTAARGLWSAWSAHASSTCRRGPGSWRGAFRLPLIGAGWALRQLPFIVEQVLEEMIAPLGRRLRPGDLRAAGDGIGAEARAILALPSEALILDEGAFRGRAHQ